MDMGMFDRPELRALARATLRGTLQNDILKEFIAQNEHLIYVALLVCQRTRISLRINHEQVGHEYRQILAALRARDAESAARPNPGPCPECPHGMGGVLT